MNCCICAALSERASSRSWLGMKSSYRLADKDWPLHAACRRFQSRRSWAEAAMRSIAFACRGQARPSAAEEEDCGDMGCVLHNALHTILACRTGQRTSTIQIGVSRVSDLLSAVARSAKAEAITGKCRKFHPEYRCAHAGYAVLSSVIARSEATRQSRVVYVALDCFASLATTAVHVSRPATDLPDEHRSANLVNPLSQKYFDFPKQQIMR